MGEYAKYAGTEIKIGTCEDMYYLRADQAHLVGSLPNSVDPVKDRLAIRFRFPFPDEDDAQPGAGESFADFKRSIPTAVPVPDGVDHYGAPGCHGTAHVSQQKHLEDGHLCLIGTCGDCGSKWRYPTYLDAYPVIEDLMGRAIENKSEFYGKVAARIALGYGVKLDSKLAK